MDCLLAIDQGTTATTVLVVDDSGRVLGESSQDHPQHFPKTGYVEHYGDEIKQSLRQATIDALDRSQVSPNKIAALGITNQRETTCLFDKNNRSDIPFVVWQCRRSEDICHDLKQKNMSQLIHQKTGLHLDPYFSATKLLWLFREHPNIYQKARQGDILFGTIDTFLCHWISGGTAHFTDPTNASRTMLMDIDTCQWSDELLDLFSVPKPCLPKIKNTVDVYAKTKGLDFLPDGIPISALVGDQQASLFGQACFNQGDAKATYGTGCFILLNTGKTKVVSSSGLLTSVAYKIGSDVNYCLEGSAFIAGAAVSFMRDAFGLIDSAEQIEPLARQVSSSEGVCFVPTLCGLGAPHWQPSAKGTISGLTRGTTKAHIARATLEGIALQNTDIMNAMVKDAPTLSSIKVDGGASNNDLLMQMQADLLNISCIRSKSAQKTALGAAYLAGLSVGIFKTLDDIQNVAQNDCKTFTPSSDRTWAQEATMLYQRALSKI